jgi:hypothetical protein
MRTFRCECGSRVFFDNTRCLSCERELGFLPDQGVIAAIQPEEPGAYSARSGRYRKCSNYVDRGVCNWMIPASDEAELCQACRLNNVIPDLSNPDNHRLWGEIEKAKRRLVYGLNRLHLRLVPKSEDAERGLSFDIKADVGTARVLTGHAEGLITLNVAEADPVERERMRVSMNERYRTLLGHFRHEIGHYYWERLVRDTPQLAEYRRLFGDETRDYSEALKQHYDLGPPPNWPDSFISAYAASHPWEDWAESFAHYLHLVDTLDTAQHFGFTSQLPTRTSLANVSDFELLMDEWVELTIALNALNRSMGLPDAYPFSISAPARQKLEMVHRLIREHRSRA